MLQEQLHIHNLQVLYLHKKMQHPMSQQEKKHLIGTISGRDKQRMVQFWRKMLRQGTIDQEMHITTHVISQLEAAEQHSHLADLQEGQIAAIAQYMEKVQLFDYIVPLLYTLQFKHRLQIVTTQSMLFKTMVEQFQHLPTDQVRGMASEMLVAMLRQNNGWLKWANNPYYFMEYLLHLVNQEEDPSRIRSRFEDIKQLYILGGSQQYLFYKNDFRLLVDILLRNIQNYDDEGQLITLIETYLVLSICPYLLVDHQFYRLEEIIMALSEVNGSQTLQAYIHQLDSLLKEQH